MNIKIYREKINQGENLSKDEAYKMQELIISGEISTAELLQLFEAFEKKDMTQEELFGIVEATRNHMISVPVDYDVLDTCGTGGDRFHTFNISTIAALICASVEIPVAKHGNKAGISICGSADLLEALGVNIQLTPDKAMKCLARCGIVFLFAPLFHPALKYVKDVRKHYGKKTYFNILGPLLNPAHASHQYIGISDNTKAQLMGDVLISSGSKKVIIVHGKEGLDEISIERASIIHEFKKDEYVSYDICPSDFHIYPIHLREIQTSSLQENITITQNILNNRGTIAQTNAVILNAACAMMAFGKVQTMKEGIEISREALESGNVFKKLQEFITISNTL